MEGGGGLRKRPTVATTAMSSITAETQPQQNVTTANGAANDNKPLEYHWQRRRVTSFVWLLLRLIGCGYYCMGLVWRTSLLHTGSECEMTYSYRNFLEIQVHPFTTTTTTSYKLYKFVDGRDPRYQKLLHDPQPLVGNAHCSGISSNRHSTNHRNNTLVLYVPGHWGSFDQARSVGAHGTQWTRARQQQIETGQKAMMDGTWSGNEENIENFIYEVYAVDFSEQGGALHGRFLELQSDFVARVVEFLAETCSVDRILIVAHSMGGYVARLAPNRHPNIRRYVPNIITLATPHDNPLYAFDESIHRVHQSISMQPNDDILVLSISGGLRDEMIDPQSCAIKHGSSPTYLSTTLMTNGLLGMDHRAIVWCHGLLEQVRKVIWVLSKNQSSRHSIENREESVTQVLGESSFEKDLEALTSTMTTQYGALKALAMESSMLYNLPILLGLFSVGSGLYCAVADSPWMQQQEYLYYHSFFPPFDAIGAFMCGLLSNFTTTTAVGSNHHHLSIVSLVTLVLVANSIHRLICSLLRCFCCRVSPATCIIGSHRRSFRFWLLSTTFVILGIIMILATLVVARATTTGSWDHWLLRLLEHWTVNGLLGSFVYVAGVVAVYLVCFWLVGRQQQGGGDSNIAFCSLILLTVPGMVAGTMTLMVWEQGVEHFQSWWLWATLVVPVTTACILKGTRQNPLSSMYSKTRTLCLLLVVVSLSQWILKRGNAYQVGHLVVSVALSEVFFEVLDRIW